MRHTPARMCIRLFSTLAVAAVTFALSACSSTGPEDDPLNDAFEHELSRLAQEVSAFGGVGSEGSTVVVYTLGDDAEAGAEIRSRLDPFFVSEPNGYDVRVRPATGNAGAELVTQVQAALTPALAVEFDANTRHVRVAARTLLSARQAIQEISASDVPMDDVIVLLRTSD